MKQAATTLLQRMGAGSDRGVYMLHAMGHGLSVVSGRVMSVGQWGGAWSFLVGHCSTDREKVWKVELYLFWGNILI